jgi:hypothetical protein
MFMKNNNPATAPKASHKGSITGFVLALISLFSSGIGHLLVHAKPELASSTNNDINVKVGNAVSTGTTKVVGTVLGVPFSVLGITLAIIAVLFVVLRLRKVRTGGFVFSALTIFIAIWSLKISIAVFELIKAHPAA